MKRIVLPILMVVVFAAWLGALPAGRTIVNPEGAPLFFAFLPRQEPSVIGSTGEFTNDPDELIQGIQGFSGTVHTLAPGGMWRIPAESGVVAGFFGDGAASVALQLVAMPLPAGTAPVLVVPLGGETSRIERWQVPEYSEPIILDGMDGDWESRDPLVRFGAMEQPGRTEDSLSGERLSPDDARFWRERGTGIRSVKSVLGADWWYVAIDTTEPVEAGTFYHFRLFPDRDTASSAGQLVVPVDERSGPVVFRAPGGAVTLVGQYVRRGTFLELSIARETVESMMPLAFEHDWSVDIASSHGDDATREHFTWGTIYLNDIAGR